jgi:hypothetical protein
MSAGERWGAGKAERRVFHPSGGGGPTFDRERAPVACRTSFVTPQEAGPTFGANKRRRRANVVFNPSRRGKETTSAPTSAAPCRTSVFTPQRGQTDCSAPNERRRRAERQVSLLGGGRTDVRRRGLPAPEAEERVPPRRRNSLSLGI